MKKSLPWLLLAPAALAVVVILLLPLAGTVGLTFDGREWYSNYVAFFRSGLNLSVLYRTLEIALVTTAISIVLGLPTAHVIARSPKSRRTLLIVCAVFPLLTSTVVRSFSWIVILGRNGFVNQVLQGIGVIDTPVGLLYTQTAVIIGLVHLFTPLMILSLVGVMENIEADVLQAASSLGASPAATFRQVVLPLAMPGIVVGSVLVFTGSFTAYTTPQLLGGDRQTVLATFLYQKAMISFDWAMASTIAVLMVVLTVVVILAMNSLARRLNPVGA